MGWNPLRILVTCPLWAPPSPTRRKRTRNLGSSRFVRQGQRTSSHGQSPSAWLARIVSACIKYNTPVIVENPASSRLWKAPPFLNLLRKCSSRIFHHCMYGSSLMKPARLMFLNISLDGVIRRCSGPRGIRAGTGLPHDVLRGTDSKGVFKTARASAYPFGFCFDLAFLTIPQFSNPTHYPPPPGH